MLEQLNIGFKRNKSNLEMILFGLLSQHSIIPLFQFHIHGTKNRH
jgi:hypothetical protein